MARRKEPEGDFLHELIEKGTKRNPAFPEMVEAAYQARLLARELAERRVSAGLTQRDIAERIGTTQSAIARLESCDTDLRVTTLQRYAMALGTTVKIA